MVKAPEVGQRSRSPASALPAPVNEHRECGITACPRAGDRQL